MKTGKCCALKLLNNPGGARLQGESSGEGGYNTCEDLPRPGYYFSIKIVNFGTNYNID